MEKTYAIGTSSEPRSSINGKDIFTFFAELKESTKYRESEIVNFCNKWTIDVTKLVATDGGIKNNFLKVRGKYMPLVEKFVKGNLFIYKEDLNLVNEHLSAFKLQVSPSPALVSKTVQSLYITFHTNSYLDAIERVIPIGHPDLEKKGFRLELYLVDQNIRKAGTTNLIELSGITINEIIKAKNVEALLSYDFKDNLIIHSIERDEKGNKKVVLKFGFPHQGQREYKNTDLVASHENGMGLEDTIIFYIWDFIANSNGKNIKLCIVCGRKVSRPDSSYCDNQSCKQKVRSKRNLKK